MRCIARRYWHTSRCSKILAAMVERRYWMRTRQSSSSTPPLRSCMPASSIPTLDRRFHRRCSHCRPVGAGHAGGRQSRLRTCTRHERCVVGNGYGGELWPAVEIADTEIQRPGADHAAFAAVSAAAGCSRSEVRAARDDDEESGRCAEGGSGTSTPRSSNSMRSRLRGGLDTPWGSMTTSTRGPDCRMRPATGDAALVHDGRRPRALLKPLRATVIAASVSDVRPSASKPVLESACVALFAGGVPVAQSTGIRQRAHVTDRLNGAVRAAVLRCRPVVRRCMNAREQTPAGGRQGR